LQFPLAATLCPPQIWKRLHLRFFALEDIYDEEVESAVQDAYQCDYLMFSFDSWS